MSTNAKFEDIVIKRKVKTVHVASNIPLELADKCELIAIKRGLVKGDRGKANMSELIKRLMEEAK